MTVVKLPETIPELIEYLELHNFETLLVSFNMSSSPSVRKFGITEPTTIDISMECYVKNEEK